MLKAINSLIDSGLINEDIKSQLVESWNSQLTEARAQIATEMRAEFASRYEHDKSVLVDALDRLVTESLSTEINEFVAEKKAVAEERAKAKKAMRESAAKFDAFLRNTLKEEMKEFVNDRKIYESNLSKVEKFITKTLAEEINEFVEDKKDLHATKVRLVAESKDKINKMRESFIQKSAKLVESSVTNTLKAELTQLKEDITIARQNNFGRQLYEAFASEFGASYLNKNAEMRKLTKKIDVLNKKVFESDAKAKTANALVESRTKELNTIKDSISRNKTLNELLKPLAGEKRALMKNLLESVATDKLTKAFDKYLPSVINDKKTTRNPLNETVTSTSVTGNKVAKDTGTTDEMNNIVDIRRLAGITK